MPQQVSIQIANRTYELACGDGEEPRVQELAAYVDSKVTELRRQMKQHPCHACNDREAHARWADRWWRLKRETDQLSGQIRGRTGAVAQVFDRVTDVLVELGYLVNQDGALTGSCSITSLDANNTPGFINLDAAPDSCGDIDAAHNPHVAGP